MSTTGKVTGIVSNLVTVAVDGPVAENELCYISLGGTRLLAEVIKVNGDKASVQVFESTRGLKNGDSVEFLGKMLEVTLGPGLLSGIYDGLQNNLTTMEGVFLKRGEYTEPLDHAANCEFTKTKRMFRTKGFPSRLLHLSIIAFFCRNNSCSMRNWPP